MDTRRLPIEIFLLIKLLRLEVFAVRFGLGLPSTYFPYSYFLYALPIPLSLYYGSRCEKLQYVEVVLQELILIIFVSVNLTGVGRVDMSNFELLKVLGTGGK